MLGGGATWIGGVFSKGKVASVASITLIRVQGGGGDLGGSLRGLVGFGGGFLKMLNF